MLHDALGRVLGRQVVVAGPRTLALPVGGLPPGLYLLRFTAPGGRVWTTRLLRE